MKTSIWQYKPWWCQPWSIVLTSFAIIGGSWLLLHRVWLTSLIAVPILAWMSYFLFLYPRLMAELIAAEANSELNQPEQS